MGIWEKQGAPEPGAGKRRLGLALLAGILATVMGLALLPATGSAATQYPDLQGAQSRNFEGGPGGWRGQAEADGLLSELVPSNLLSGSGLPLDDLLPTLDLLDLCSILPLPLPVVCEDASIEWGHAESGGSPEGGGYLAGRSTGLANVLSSAGTTWESPLFVYNGDNGKVPDLLNFKMDVLADGGSLFTVLNDLGLAESLEDLDLNLINLNLDQLEQVSFRAELVSESGSVVEVLVPEAPLISVLQLDPAEILSLTENEEQSWETVGPIQVDPSELERGAIYALRITTTYDGLLGVADVLSEFNHGLDNISLSAVTGQDGQGGQDGQDGSGGQDGSAGGSGGDGQDGRRGRDGDRGGRGAAGALTVRQMRALVNRAGPRRARVARNGRWIRIATACPRRLNKVCRFRTVAAFNRRGAAITRPKSRQVGRGVRRTQALFVKPSARKQVRRAKRVFVKQVVRVGDRRMRVMKPVRLQSRAFRNRR